MFSKKAILVIKKISGKATQRKRLLGKGIYPRIGSLYSSFFMRLYKNISVILGTFSSE